MFHDSVCTTATDARFALMGTPRRVWAIPAIHGDLERLMGLHDSLLPVLCPGDRIVYLGNYAGPGSDPCGTIDEILTFRRLVLALPGMMAHDIVYLRGIQEEIWNKLLQIQFCNNPYDVMIWMYGQGVAHTLAAYGHDPQDGLNAAQEGVMSLTRWTGRLRQTLRRYKGHEIFATQQRRAGLTSENISCPLLFVHAGLDPRKSLLDQGDNFWWGAPQFNAMRDAYAPFRKVIRGYDPARQGLKIDRITATIDGGCGFGGPLVCAGFDRQGAVFELLEA